MKSAMHSSHPRPVITQAENNTTLWIGHLHTDPTDHFGGQTFTCPSNGLLDNIQVFSAAVQYPGELTLTFHEFDAASRLWGPALGEAVVAIGKNDCNRWLSFALPSISLQQGKHYGFRLHTNNALVAIGEAAAGTKKPFSFGHEWNADSNNQKGHYFSYFSLAFKVELCA